MDSYTLQAGLSGPLVPKSLICPTISLLVIAQLGVPNVLYAHFCTRAVICLENTQYSRVDGSHVCILATKLPTESCVLCRLAVWGLNHHMWQIFCLRLWQLTLRSGHSQIIQEFNCKSHFSYYLVKATRVGSADLRLFNWTTLNRAEWGKTLDHHMKYASQVPAWSRN